jgi:manganese/zinc/iron transport system permease protein
MTLTGMAIVISIQAVGVVLLSALLITPAATALLLTDRLPRMVVISSLLGALAGLIGLNASSLRDNLPTGPVVVLSLAALFVLALVFSPRYGLVTQALRRWKRRREAASTEEEALP